MWSLSFVSAVVVTPLLVILLSPARVRERSGKLRAVLCPHLWLTVVVGLDAVRLYLTLSRKRVSAKITETNWVRRGFPKCAEKRTKNAISIAK